MYIKNEINQLKSALLWLFRSLICLFFFFSVRLAVDENDTHVRATHNTTTTTTTTTTITFNTTTNRTKVRMKCPKNTLNRPQPLYSQKIVIGSEELVGRDIDNVVRQRINTFEKSPKVVRSTALIIKSSKISAKSLKAGKEIANETYVFPTPDSGTIITTVIDDGPFDSNTVGKILRRSNEQVSMLVRQENEVECRGIGTMTKTANGYIASETTDVEDVRNEVEATKRRERTGKLGDEFLLHSLNNNTYVQIVPFDFDILILSVLLFPMKNISYKT